MCNSNVPSITLQTAVLMQATEFAKNQLTFSVHDITVRIRSKVKNGEWEIPETEVSGTSFRNDIPHVSVKALFDELWRTGVFDSEFTLTRNFNGKFFVYSATLVNSTNNAVPAVSAIPVTQTPVNQVTPSPVPQPVIVHPPKVDKNVIVVRVEKYLDRCSNRNFQPTLKQVQSAIKRDNFSTGWSCEELNDIIEQDLGYAISTNPDYISISQVVI